MVFLFLAKFFSFCWLSFLFFFFLHNNMEKLFFPRSFLSTLLELHPRNYENKVEHCSTPFSPLDCHSWQQECPIITWNEIMIISSCRIWVAQKRDGFVNLSLKLPHKCVPFRSPATISWSRDSPTSVPWPCAGPRPVGNRAMQASGKCMNSCKQYVWETIPFPYCHYCHFTQPETLGISVMVGS